jgi:hypothetical protein
MQVMIWMRLRSRMEAASIVCVQAAKTRCRRHVSRDEALQSVSPSISVGRLGVIVLSVLMCRVRWLRRDKIRVGERDPSQQAISQAKRSSESHTNSLPTSSQTPRSASISALAEKGREIFVSISVCSTPRVKKTRYVTQQIIDQRSHTISSLSPSVLVTQNSSW